MIYISNAKINLVSIAIKDYRYVDVFVPHFSRDATFYDLTFLLPP
jgi:hypothetical protein